MATTFPSTSFPSDIPNLSIQPKTCNINMSHVTCDKQPASAKCEQPLSNVNCLQLQGHLPPALLTTSSQNQLTLLGGCTVTEILNWKLFIFWQKICLSIEQQKSSSTSAQKIAQSRSRGHRGGVSQVASLKQLPTKGRPGRVHLVRGVKEAVDLDGGEEAGSLEVDSVAFGRGKWEPFIWSRTAMWSSISITPGVSISKRTDQD